MAGNYADQKDNRSRFSRVMEIYAHARQFMAEHGNPNQWAPTKWPPEDLIHEDIRQGKGRVCVDAGGAIIAAFFFDYGDDIEPTYRKIEDGAWRDDQPYGVVHRIAVDGSRKGIGAFCINWAYSQCGRLGRGCTIVKGILITKMQ